MPRPKIWSFEDLIEFINATIDTKCGNINSSIVKHVSVANSCVGPEFLAQVKQHYHLRYNEPNIKSRNFSICYDIKDGSPKKD